MWRGGVQEVATQSSFPAVDQLDHHRCTQHLRQVAVRIQHLWLCEPKAFVAQSPDDPVAHVICPRTCDFPFPRSLDRDSRPTHVHVSEVQYHVIPHQRREGDITHGGRSTSPRVPGPCCAHAVKLRILNRGGIFSFLARIFNPLPQLQPHFKLTHLFQPTLQQYPRRFTRVSSARSKV